MGRSEIGAWVAAECLVLVDEGFTFILDYGAESLRVDLFKGNRKVRRDMRWDMLDQAVNPKFMVQAMVKDSAALLTEPTAA